MEIDIGLIFDILKLVVPTVIALVSLAYVIKQRNVVKTEISKKRYLESALTNLNEAIKFLNDIDIPDISDLHSLDPFDMWADVRNEADFICYDILRASFEMKTKIIPVHISYRIMIFGQRVEPESEMVAKDIRNFNELDIQWFISLLRSNRGFAITSQPRIHDFQQSDYSDINFMGFEWGIENLKKALEALSPYEEVYETVSPNTVRKIAPLFEEIADEIFKTISKSKTIKLDLQKFNETNEIITYLIDKALNYSHLADKFSKVSELVSKLIEARKELFLKIS